MLSHYLEKKEKITVEIVCLLLLESGKLYFGKVVKKEVAQSLLRTHPILKETFAALGVLVVALVLSVFAGTVHAPSSQGEVLPANTVTSPWTEFYNQYKDDPFWGNIFMHLANDEERISALESQSPVASEGDLLTSIFHWFSWWWLAGWWGGWIWIAVWVFIGWQLWRLRAWRFVFWRPWWFWIPLFWFIPWIIIGFWYWKVVFVSWIWWWWIFPWFFWVPWWVIFYKHWILWFRKP